MLRLLIVDDEPIILRGIKLMIQDSGSAFTEIETASDAIGALQLMESFSPDLLITDIQMPEMDGLRLIAEAQQRGVDHIVILTGYDLFDYARQAVRLHVNDYLLKPIQRRELMEVLRRIAIEVIAGRADAGASSPRKGEHPRSSNPTIRRFRAYVQTNFMYDLSLDDVASHLSLHPNYVCNVVKRETGMTFVHYLQDVRIEKAKELLRQPEMLTVDRVAACVGYENARNFYKVFKEHTGRTPGEYRDFLLKNGHEDSYE